MLRNLLRLSLRLRTIAKFLNKGMMTLLDANHRYPGTPKIEHPQTGRKYRTSRREKVEEKAVSTRLGSSDTSWWSVHFDRIKSGLCDQQTSHRDLLQAGSFVPYISRR